jgi:hypothetical protein
MALIKCRECGKPVSSSAHHCPSCGVLVKRLSLLRVVILFLIVGTVLAFLVNYLKFWLSL